MSAEAPERVFIAPNRAYENIWGRPFVTDDFDEDGTEYVRIDKLEELAAENERLKRINANLMGDDENTPRYTTKRLKQEVERWVEAALAERDKEIADATAYAENLASALHSQHYAENTSWRPLSGDLVGLLTQIDNMTAGLARNAAFLTAAEQAEPARDAGPVAYGVKASTTMRFSSVYLACDYEHGDLGSYRKDLIVPLYTHPTPSEARLREALESIANNACCGGCQEAALVARAALKEASE